MLIKFVTEYQELESLEINACGKGYFSTALWQPKAATTFQQSTGINLVKENQKQHYEKAKVFLEVSKECDLILTPEYSFPWDLLDEIILTNLYKPKDKSLWCFCMQGILTDDFEIKMSSYASCVPKDFKIDFIEKNKYVNVLIYIINHKGNMYILPQLKREPTRFEKTHMSVGSRIFVFNTGKRNFFSYICADTNLHKEENKLITHEYENIIFHPQFNEKIFDETFNSRKRESLELSNNIYISLNWAHPTTILESNVEYGGYSSISCRSDESFNNFETDIDFKKLIDQNHCKGLFFLQERNKKEFNHFLYVDDQILLVEINFFQVREKEKEKYNLLININKCLIYKEQDSKYGIYNKCRIDLDNIIHPEIQKDVFSKCKCCVGPCKTPCINDSNVTAYERFFSICSGVFNEKEAFQHNCEVMCRNTYRYRDIQQCKANRSFIKALVDKVYDESGCDLGTIYSNWKTVILKLDENEYANAEFASINGMDKEKGIIAIANTEDLQQVKKVFDRFLEKQKNKGDGKNLLLFYGEGFNIKIFDNAQYSTDLSQKNYSAQFSAQNNFRK